MSGSFGAANKGGITGAAIGGLIGGLPGAVIGGIGGAYQGYSSAKAEKAGREASASLFDTIAEPPPPPPAAKPATLAQAAAAVHAKTTNSVPIKSKASGTIGEQGPQGLQSPVKTANVTLLGGSK